MNIRKAIAPRPKFAIAFLEYGQSTDTIMMTQSTLDVTQTSVDQLPKIHTDRLITFGTKTQIYADCLIKGDIISHLGQVLEVYSEPRYTHRGIVFEVLPLDSGERPYEVSFDPNWRFDYVAHNSQEAA